MNRRALLLALALAACADNTPPAYVRGPTVTEALPGPAYGGPDRDCADFATHADAQAFFDLGSGDRHTLDADRDGVACESLQ